MIKIVLSDFPDKYRVKTAQISDVLSGRPSDLYFYTEITAGAVDDYWDVDVYTMLGPALNIRLPQLSLENVATEKMIDILMEYDNGGAAAFLKALGGPALVEGAWERHLTASMPRRPSSL